MAAYSRSPSRSWLERDRGKGAVSGSFQEGELVAGFSPVLITSSIAVPVMNLSL